MSCSDDLTGHARWLTEWAIYWVGAACNTPIPHTYRPLPPACDCGGRNEAARTLLEQWMGEPDGLGDDWWDDFDKEMEEARFQILERDE